MESMKPVVLLVDDDPAMLRIVQAMLASAGYEVRTAGNGEEALAAFDAIQPQFVITDWEMPRMDGVSLVRRIRELPLPHYVYILMLTARSGSDDLVEALSAGVNDFLNKPIVRGELLARLQTGGRILDLERRLLDLARTDMLTGLPTRRAFFEQFDRELARAKRFRVPLSCVMLDVDFFKRVNDTHGHSVGDEVLKAVADLARECCRVSDHVCRYGGEEFCVLLTQTTEAAAAVWAERLRSAIATSHVRAGGKTIRVTASFGVAQLLDDADKAAEVIELADQALLLAKQSGRDRVVRSSDVAQRAPVTDGDLRGARSAFEGVTAGNVMTTLVTCLSQDDTLATAAEFFLRFRINSSPVVDGHGKLAGILSEKDVMARMTSENGWKQSIRDCLNPRVVCYSEDTPIDLIYDFLCRVAIRRVVIVRDGYPVGVISRGTLLRWYMNWLTIHRDAAVSDNPEAAEAQRRRAKHGVARAAEMLQWHAIRLRHQLTSSGPDEDVVPAMVDGASQIQELVNDLLADSRYALEPLEFTSPPVPLSNGQNSPARD